MKQCLGLLGLFSPVKSGYLTNNFVVELQPEYLPETQSLLKRHGLEVRSVPDGLLGENTFLLKRSGMPNLLKKSQAENYMRELARDYRIRRTYPMEPLRRDKRGMRGDTFEPDTRAKGGYHGQDPLWNAEWYIQNTGQDDGTPGLDLNVTHVWQRGFTGRGVTVAILDDGVDYNHPDLFPNYSPEDSWDFSGNDPYPYPRWTSNGFNSHGTRCAGEIAAVADNGICGVGIAYNSKIAAVRMLDQPYMTDAIEASSMGFRPQNIDIYSASWGPTDDGKTVDGPRELTLQAMRDGVNKGRNGKGSIYVWASGDGGPFDDCNLDGYASSMWTISINSAVNDGETAIYDESCSSIVASTFSSGKVGARSNAGVATTDLYGNCTMKHSGTSAAAPEAAGVIALALEANPDLTWRDVQHLLVYTSKKRTLSDPRHPWQVNGAGFLFNHLFGFGVIDAGSLVEEALKWKNAPERKSCIVGEMEIDKMTFTGGEPVEMSFNTDSCAGKSNEVNYIEHVQAFISVKTSRRGDLAINMTSPMSTTSKLLQPRPRDDDSVVGLNEWPFVSVQFWGERSRGEWKVRVALSELTLQQQQAKVLKWKLVIHGTKDPWSHIPSHMSDKIKS
ncbi:Oidioi.mRNA.OKI2018_I69.PAR.g8525.t1.cds [Oikopleura dioica]|uniref:Neuroendocrine convertase 2 n=1 Tax=Oikopleura dioica TaxID=34765 RepID=A0ABN7RMA0_OIKDI|nr:Oidioi.mRNA.OKI2018_I69.PAR.g8525.t1.cds [Oikopleura dioica]